MIVVTPYFSPREGYPFNRVSGKVQVFRRLLSFKSRGPPVSIYKQMLKNEGAEIISLHFSAHKGSLYLGERCIVLKVF